MSVRHEGSEQGAVDPGRGVHTRRAAALGLGAIAATAVVAVVLVTPGGESTDLAQPASTATPGQSPAPPETPKNPRQPAMSSPREAPATLAPGAAAAVAHPSPQAGVPHPVATELCDSLHATEGFNEGITLFGRPSANPVPIQVIADPVDGPAGPFALVERFFGDDRRPSGEDAVEVDGIRFWISVHANGNGQVEWDLGDGSHGYVRSRGLDRDALTGIVTALTRRPATTPVPGFDYDPSRGSAGRLRLLHEEMAAAVDGEVAASECVVSSTGRRYRISALSGDDVFRYGGVIDRPTPLDVGVRGETVLVINGMADPTAPTVGDIVDAEPALWLDLLSEPRHDQAGTRYTVSAGADVVVPLSAVDADTPTSRLALSLETRDGATFLEVDTIDAVLAADAAFWHTTIDGHLASITTARAGPTFGSRLGDRAPGDPIEVEISVIDGGEFILQTTGPIRLVPATRHALMRD